MASCDIEHGGVSDGRCMRRKEREREKSNSAPKNPVIPTCTIKCRLNQENIILKLFPLAAPRSILNSRFLVARISRPLSLKGVHSRMLSEEFSRHYSESSEIPTTSAAAAATMGSFHGDALMSIDPIKAERLEHRLTASNSTTNLLLGGGTPQHPPLHASALPAPSSTPTSELKLVPTANIAEEDELSDMEEVSFSLQPILQA